MNNDIATALSYYIKSEAILLQFKKRILNDFSYNCACFFDLLDSRSKGYLSAYDFVKILHQEGFNEMQERHLIFFIQPFFKNNKEYNELYQNEGRELQNKKRSFQFLT
jgi:hypothetical protein